MFDRPHLPNTQEDEPSAGCPTRRVRAIDGVVEAREARTEDFSAGCELRWLIAIATEQQRHAGGRPQQQAGDSE